MKWFIKDLRKQTYRLPYLIYSLIFGITIVFVLIFNIFAAAQKFHRSPAALALALPDSNRDILAFVSDTQEPMWVETLKLKKDRNEEATASIFSRLTKEPGVLALFHLGDITAIGFYESEWTKMDTYFAALRHANISIYPVPGNHEYLLRPKQGKKAFLKRFPECEPTWYVKRFGAVAVILLNSNFSNLTDIENNEQLIWYKSEITELEKDSTVKSIIIGTHYSPFTNSTIVNPSIEVQELFLPTFLGSAKCKVFIGGHSHAFEHFKQQGKDFLVIGGGGGLLQPLLLGAESRYEDIFPQKTGRRMFHYLLCKQNGDTLNLKVEMINEDYLTFNTVYELNIGGIK